MKKFMFISLLCSTLGLSNLFGWCDSNPRHNCSACYSGGSTLQKTHQLN